MDALDEGDPERPTPREALADESRASALPSLESLRAVLERWRGTPLILVALPMPPGRPAVWIGVADRDYILYEPSLPSCQQVWAVAREAGHMLAGHRGSVAQGDVAAGLFPDLDPAVVGAELPAPAAFTATEVHEAEALATALVASTAPAPGPASQPPSAPLRNRATIA
jgi:hypothetical protein